MMNASQKYIYARRRKRYSPTQLYKLSIILAFFLLSTLISLLLLLGSGSLVATVERAGRGAGGDRPHGGRWPVLRPRRVPRAGGRPVRRRRRGATDVTRVLLLLFAVPIGVFTAVYLEEYADKTKWYNRLLEINIQNLAAVPSIVYGILGLAFIVREELGVGIRTVAGPALERKGDMAAILTGLEDRDVPGAFGDYAFTFAVLIVLAKDSEAIKPAIEPYKDGEGYDFPGLTVNCSTRKP